MSQFEQWRLAITPLSPVHLGTGQDYEPTGYVIDEGTLYEFDGIAALQALQPKEREKLGRILGAKPTPDMLLQVQTFFHANRDRLIAVSRNQVRVNSTVEGFYRDRVGRVAQHETGGGRVQNRLEIERTAYNPPTGEAIIPGSGIKGAIRTALLEDVNEGKELRTTTDRHTGRTRKENNQELQNRLFGYRAGKFELDPMRLVRLSDAALNAPDVFATEVRFAVNRKKQPVRKGDTLIQSQAEQKNLYQLLECLPGMQLRAFTGEISLQGDGGLQSDKWPKRRFALPQIAASCNSFYRPIFERELGLLRERGYLDEDWGEGVRELLDGTLGKALEDNRAFLLRVGRHSGAESATLNGVRHIKIIKGRGEPPEFLDEAKTLWLATNERQAQRNLLPFGWLLVEPYREPDELTSWAVSDADAEVSRWRTALRERQIGLREAMVAERRKEEARQQTQEQAKREAEERASRLAAMSEEGRKIEHLRALLDRDKASNRKEKGGELAGSLVGVLREAEDGWHGPDCATLADLALEIYKHIGWPSKDKKKQRKAQIEAIKGRA